MTADRQPHALIIAHTFPPHAAIGSQRTMRVLKQLHARGWRVTVLTGDPATYLPHTPVDTALLAQIPPGVRVLRAGTWHAWTHFGNALMRPFKKKPAPAASRPASTEAKAPSRPSRSGVKGALGRIHDVIDALLSIPDGEAGWLVPAILTASRELRHDRPDVIYSSAPPWTGQLVAYGVRLRLGAPWVADFRDPWGRAPWRGDRLRVAIRAAAGLERMVVGKADHILFAARGNRDEFARHYGPAAAARFHFITNGCDPEEFRRLPAAAPPADGRFVLLHAGSLYAGRTPTSVLHAAAEAVRRGLIDRQRLTIRFLGSQGLRDVEFPALCRELQLEGNVEFLPSVPRAESLAAMTSASALLILQPGHTVSVPGKLFEYLAAGRPILAVAEEGEIADIVRASGIGFSVRPEDDEGLVDAIGQLAALAQRDVPRPSETLFDGNTSAARAVGILEAVVRGERVPAQPSLSEPTPETTARLS